MWQSGDRLLQTSVLLAMLLGVVFVFSVTSVLGNAPPLRGYFYLWRQLGAAVFSVLVIVFLKNIHYRFLEHQKLMTAMIVCCVLLVAVYFLDPRTHRWFRLGVVSIQPAEFAKVILVVFLASALAADAPLRAFSQRKTDSVIVVLILLTMIADSGTGILMALVVMALFWIAKRPGRAIRIPALVLAISAAGFIVSRPYRLARVVYFFDPHFGVAGQADPPGPLAQYLHRSIAADPDYQRRQSLVAVGSGGLIGRGLGQSREKYFYLPQAHTDFIFAIVGEETGMAGSIALLLLYGVIFWRGMVIAAGSGTVFGGYLAAGATISIVLQAAVHIGVTLGMLPIKGVPLPFVSYGGSSLVASATLAGLILSVGHFDSYLRRRGDPLRTAAASGRSGP